MDDDAVLVVPVTYATPAIVTWTPHDGTTWRLVPDFTVRVEDGEGYTCSGIVKLIEADMLHIQLDVSTWRQVLDPHLSGELPLRPAVASAR
jgi:hypothetical protein